MHLPELAVVLVQVTGCCWEATREAETGNCVDNVLEESERCLCSINKQWSSNDNYDHFNSTEAHQET